MFEIKNKKIAFTGHAGCGKDTAGLGLKNIGYTRIGIADNLKAFTYLLNPAVRFRHVEWFCSDRSIATVIDDFGEEAAKKLPYDYFANAPYRGGVKSPTYPVREKWQEISQVFRATFGPMFFVKNAVENCESELQYITDLRKDDEAEYLKSKGFFIVKIERQGVERVNNNHFEDGINERFIDARIYNNSTVGCLHLSSRCVSGGIYG